MSGHLGQVLVEALVRMADDVVRFQVSGYFRCQFLRRDEVMGLLTVNDQVAHHYRVAMHIAPTQV